MSSTGQPPPSPRSHTLIEICYHLVHRQVVRLICHKACMSTHVCLCNVTYRTPPNGDSSCKAVRWMHHLALPACLVSTAVKHVSPKLRDLKAHIVQSMIKDWDIGRNKVTSTGTGRYGLHLPMVLCFLKALGGHKHCDVRVAAKELHAALSGRSSMLESSGLETTDEVITKHLACRCSALCLGSLKATRLHQAPVKNEDGYANLQEKPRKMKRS